jgi:D-sedoheptulose 7-phosphate isomerase
VNVIQESAFALAEVDADQVAATIKRFRELKGGRVFCIGNGGGFAHAAHMAADLRKIARIPAFSFDNAGEMTARINDDGWARAWSDWAEMHGYDPATDVMFMFSVGGRCFPHNTRTSENLPMAEWGIVGANGAWGNRIVIPSTSTPVIEGCQSVIAHHITEHLCA